MSFFLFIFFPDVFFVIMVGSLGDKLAVEKRSSRYTFSWRIIMFGVGFLFLTLFYKLLYLTNRFSNLFYYYYKLEKKSFVLKDK